MRGLAFLLRYGKESQSLAILPWVSGKPFPVAWTLIEG